MIERGFREQAEICLLDTFKNRLNKLKKKYKQVEKQFNSLYKELNIQPLNEEYVNEITTHLTIYLAEMDIIDESIKEISQAIERVRIELSN